MYCTVYMWCVHTMRLVINIHVQHTCTLYPITPFLKGNTDIIIFILTQNTPTQIMNSPNYNGTYSLYPSNSARSLNFCVQIHANWDQ